MKRRRSTDHEAPDPSLQRAISERLLLSAFREADEAERAETARAYAEFIEQASRVVGVSLSSTLTRDAVAGMTLPILGSWCIIDLIEIDGSISRLPMLHPDPLVQTLLRELGREWKPERGDPIGLPAVQAELTPVLITDDVDAALRSAAHSDRNLELLHKLDIGALLTIPMVSGDRLLGAMTFVNEQASPAYSPEEIRLAEKLANRNAEALEHARLYTEARLQCEQAEIAALNKLRFLANISHELRTPLNAIMGYVELIGAEIHGPLTGAQQEDLARIRMNQTHLLRLVDDLLTYVQAGTARMNEIVRVSPDDAVRAAVASIENTFSRKSLRYEHQTLVPNLFALGDEERVTQILINLVSNAVKFTARGGRIITQCTGTDEQVQIRVIDTGIGIEASRFEDIFTPFVQVNDARPSEGGVGLGLAISRDLARSMHGDLTVESARGEGSTFTLTLPRAPDEPIE